MKSKIASALVVVACVAALAACSGKGSSGAGAGASAGAGATSSAGGGASGTAPNAASQGVASNPDGDLSSIDQQLSDIGGALSFAEPTQASGDNG